jgi:hypothetical protein
MPETMLKKIDQSNLYQTFKPYTMNILIPGGNGGTWLHSVDEKEDSYCAKAQEIISGSTNGRIIISAYDDSGEQVSVLNELKDPIYLFPQGLKFERMNWNKLKELSSWMATGNLGAMPDFGGEPVDFDSLIMICAHMKRDKRCGVAGPLLIKEFNKEIKENNIPNTVVHGVSHFGGNYRIINGHKFAGNVIIYQKDSRGIWVADWYGRVLTCHVNTILTECIKGKKVLRDLWRGRMNAEPNDPNLDW